MALGWRGQYLRYRELFLNVLAIYKTKPDIRVFLEILLSLATISFFTIFALRPTLLTISGLLVEIASKEETLGKIDQKINDLGTARVNFERERSRVPMIKTSVSDDPEVDILTNQLLGASKQSSSNVLGLTIAEIVLLGDKGVQKKKEKTIELPESAGEINFSVNANGVYPALATFLSSLENLRVPLSLDSINLTLAKTDEGKTLVLVISGRSPYLGLSKNQDKVPTK